MLETALRGDPWEGVTISGGEPFLQPAALLRTLRLIRASEEELASNNWDVIVYTGMEYDEVISLPDAKAILAQVDLLITGKFKQEYPKVDLRGSSNQTLHHLSARAKERYSEAWLRCIENTNKIDLMPDDHGLVWSGIPARNDLQRLEKMLNEIGIVWQDVSWKPHRVREDAG